MTDSKERFDAMPQKTPISEAEEWWKAQRGVYNQQNNRLSSPDLYLSSSFKS